MNLTLFFFRLDLSFLGTWDPATTVATSSAADSSWTSFSSSTSSPFCPLVAIAFLEAVIGCTCSADRAPSSDGPCCSCSSESSSLCRVRLFLAAGAAADREELELACFTVRPGNIAFYWTHRRVAITTCVQWSKGPLAVVVRA